MNRKIVKAKDALLRQKKFYMFLFTLMLIGFISGIVFIFFTSNENKINITKKVTEFFNTIKASTGINYGKSLINTLLTNLLYVILIWLLGISLIGFPIIIGILFFKSFVLGLSVSSIISSYGLKGVLGAFLYIFPHSIILIILYLLLGFYSLSFCYKLFCHLFLKRSINFNYGMSKYLKILLISIFISILVSLYQVFLSTYFLKIFTSIIK